MNRLNAVLLAVAIVSTLAVTSMVLLMPDHSGEMRTDLEVGDYYTLRYSNINKTFGYEITGIDEKGILDVEVSSAGTPTYHTSMSRDSFLGMVYLLDGDAVRDEDKRAVITTAFGDRMCSLYVSNLNNYWVDSHNVIYRSSVGGNTIELLDTNLIRE